MSGDVGQCRQWHIRVGNSRKYGVEVGIAAPSFAVHKLFPLPVFVGRRLEFRYLKADVGQVGRVINMSGMVENM